ncbi:MAG: hypothetical protein ACK58T_50525 [Phycisphaerae bacterium]
MEKAKLRALAVKKSDKSHNLQIKIDPRIIEKIKKNGFDVPETVRAWMAAFAEDLK